MSMPHSKRRLGRPARGVSLVEVLVGVAISLIGILIMFQMVAISDQHTRTTASGGDAQVAGTLGIFGLERDIKPAGMGFAFATMPFMGCNVAFNDVLTARAFNFPMLPVSLTVGAAGAPDTIAVLYGNSAFFSADEALQAATATTKTQKKRGGFRLGDLAIVAGNPTGLPGGAACSLVEITASDDTDPNKTVLSHTTALYTNFYTGPNAVVRYNIPAGAGAGLATGNMYNLGPAPQLNVWTIVAGNVLRRSDLIQGAPPQDLAEGVINLKAQYGVDADANGRIADPGEWTTVAPADWTQVLAMRVAILVRSKQFERSADPTAAAPTPVTPSPAATPTWAGGTIPFVMTNVDGTPDAFGNAQSNPNNWRYYRYRVYEKVIPLRNMIWGTAR